MSENYLNGLLPAVQGGKLWLHRFTKRDYPQAFREYLAQFADLYRDAAASMGEDALAEALLDALAGGWKRQRFWNRTVAQLDDKQMLVTFLSPMLLEIGLEELCRRLRDGWAARWPKEAYQVGTHEELQSGFRNAIFGISLDGFGGRGN